MGIGNLASREALSNAVSGAAADAFSSVALFPLDAVKLRMQARSGMGAVAALEELLAGGDAAQLYRGLGSKVVTGVQQKFQYFYMYALLREAWIWRTGNRPGMLADLGLGYAAAMQGLTTTMPLEVTSTRIITAKRTGEPAPGFWAVFWEQLRSHGPASFYRTLPANAVLCINPAISLSIFEALKARLLVRRPGAEALTTLEAFLVGVVSKSIATVLTFPFIRAKVLMSVWKKEHASDESEPPGMLDTIREVVRAEGARGLYVGLEPQLAKAVTNAALMLATKEKIYVLVKALLVGKRVVAAER